MRNINTLVNDQHSVICVLGGGGKKGNALEIRYHITVTPVIGSVVLVHVNERKSHGNTLIISWYTQLRIEKRKGKKKEQLFRHWEKGKLSTKGKRTRYEKTERTEIIGRIIVCFSQ